MYTILIGIGAALLVGAGGALADLWGWLGGIFMGLLAFVVTGVVLARRLRKRLEPAMLQVRRQAEAGMLEPALRSLQDMLPLASWMPMLKGQLYAQMGVFAHYAGDDERAFAYLGKATRRAPESQALLACLHYKKGDFPAAQKVLELASAMNKRHALVHNLYAYLLHLEGRTDEAMAKLNRHLQKEPTNEASKDNLLRLQNGKKLNMKRFGMEWYALGLERPPREVGEMRQARKGFRQPPKNPVPKKAERKKRKKG